MPDSMPFPGPPAFAPNPHASLETASQSPARSVRWCRSTGALQGWTARKHGLPVMYLRSIGSCLCVALAPAVCALAVQPPAGPAHPLPWSARHGQRHTGGHSAAAAPAAEATPSRRPTQHCSIIKLQVQPGQHQPIGKSLTECELWL